MFVAIYDKFGRLLIDLLTIEEYLSIPRSLCVKAEIVQCSLI